MKRYPTVATLALAVALGGCAQDVTESNEYQALEAELADMEARVEAATVESAAIADSEMADAAAGLSGRHERALAVMTEIKAMLDDPGSYGTEAEFVDLLAAHATATAVMDDDVFGAVNYREAFYNTLFSGATDARIHVHEMWLSDDGTQGGFLWTWSGTNSAGNPFELNGISLNEFDEDGRISYELVTYPYPDEYVFGAFLGEGTPTPTTGS